MGPPPAAGAVQLLQRRDGHLHCAYTHDATVRRGNPATLPRPKASFEARALVTEPAAHQCLCSRSMPTLPMPVFIDAALH
jgi:hypothetical protein